MGKDTNIRPNERLLALLRPSGSATSRAAESPGGPAAATSCPNVLPRRFFSRRRYAFIGVDISPQQLVCIKVTGQDAHFAVRQARIVPLPDEAQPGTEAFVATLRRSLSDLCAAGETPRIWAATQGARVNVQYVTIPKVAARLVDNAVYWTAKKEMGFDEDAVVFDFERRGEVTERGSQRLGALAYTAERAKACRIRDDFVQAGFPLSGLTMEPFTYQTLGRRGVTPDVAGTTANLHVGHNWSRLEISADGKLMFVRSIKTSMSGMEQAVLDALEVRAKAFAAPPVADAAPSFVPAGRVEAADESVLDLDALNLGDADFTLELDIPQVASAAPSREVVAAPPPPTVTLKDAQTLFQGFVFGSGACTPTLEALGVDGTEKAVMAMLEPAAARLVRQVEMTLKHFRESLGFAAVTRLTVSGLLGANRVFLDYIGDQLGLPCVALDPLHARRLAGGEVPTLSAPSVIYAQAVGLALADDDVTPNILRTYKAKAEARLTRRWEQSALAVLAVVLLGLSFFFVQSVWTCRQLAAEQQRLSRTLASLGGRPDLAAVTGQVAALQARRDAARCFVARGQVLGLWGTALSLAPQGVRLGTLAAKFGPPRLAAQTKPKPRGRRRPPPPTSSIEVTGLVMGDARLFDSRLASYVVALESSPVFDEARVKQQVVERLDNGATGLRFVIELTVPES